MVYIFYLMGFIQFIFNYIYICIILCGLKIYINEKYIEWNIYMSYNKVLYIYCIIFEKIYMYLFFHFFVLYIFHFNLTVNILYCIYSLNIYVTTYPSNKNTTRIYNQLVWKLCNNNQLHKTVSFKTRSHSMNLQNNGFRV